MEARKYKLVGAPVDRIEEAVNRLIQEGWQPFGSPFLIPAKAETVSLQPDMVYQAMIRST